MTGGAVYGTKWRFCVTKGGCFNRIALSYLLKVGNVVSDVGRGGVSPPQFPQTYLRGYQPNARRRPAAAPMG